MDDEADFHETCRALSLLGITEAWQEHMFRVLAGILHLGNVTIEDSGGDASAINVRTGGGECSGLTGRVYYRPFNSTWLLLEREFQVLWESPAHF